MKAGLVRCGDCENVFNATWNLVETDVGESEPSQDDDRDFSDTTRFTDHVEDSITASSLDEDTSDDEPGGTDIRHGTDNARESFDDDPGDDRDDDISDIGDSDDDTISDEEIRRTLHLDEDINNDFDDDAPLRVERNDVVDNHLRHDHDTSNAGVSNTHGAHMKRIEPRLGSAPPGELSVSADDGLLSRRPPRNESRNQPRRDDRSGRKRRSTIQLKAPVKPHPANAHNNKPNLESNEYEITPRVDPNVHWVAIPDNDNRGTQLLWASGALLMLVLMVMQVRFILIDPLYSIPATRPYISLFCEFAGCQAPVRTDPASIDIAQTRVDLNPEVPGAVRIKVNLINRADFAQPYPPLQLTLTDKDGRIVGRRTYLPTDYLDGEAATALLDPQILAIATLDLAHPNENAVGFETIVVTGAG